MTSVSTRALTLAMVQDDGTLPLERLYAIARATGIGDEQLRLCLRRLVADGALKRTSGRGRKATYRAAPEVATRILPETEFLAFALRRDAGEEPWDGLWRLVAFSIPEATRRHRDELRARLVFLGGAPVHGGLYVSPNPWEPYIAALAAERELGDHLTLVTAPELSVGGVSDPPALARRLWPLQELAQRWERFVASTEERLRATPPDAAHAAASAVAVVVEFAAAIEPDPLLPDELLPDDWPGAAARRLLFDASHELAALAGEHLPAGVRQLIALDDRRAA